MIHTLRRLAGLSMAVAAIGPLGSACSAEDVTGEPEGIGTLVHVVPDGSRCIHDDGDDTVRFEVRLSNTGGDDRTVAVTPVRRFADGQEVGTSVEGFSVTVPGGGEADHGISVDGVSDDLAGCFVRIDDGDPIEVDVQSGDAG